MTIKPKEKIFNAIEWSWYEAVHDNTIMTSSLAFSLEITIVLWKSFYSSFSRRSTNWPGSFTGSSFFRLSSTSGRKLLQTLVIQKLLWSFRMTESLLENLSHASTANKYWNFYSPVYWPAETWFDFTMPINGPKMMRKSLL